MAMINYYASPTGTGTGLTADSPASIVEAKALVRGRVAAGSLEEQQQSSWPFIDNFNRTGPSLGANWVLSGSNSIGIVGNTVRELDSDVSEESRDTYANLASPPTTPNIYAQFMAHLSSTQSSAHLIVRGLSAKRVGNSTNVHNSNNALLTTFSDNNNFIRLEVEGTSGSVYSKAASGDSWVSRGTFSFTPVGTNVGFEIVTWDFEQPTVYVDDFEAGILP